MDRFTVFWRNWDNHYQQLKGSTVKHAIISSLVLLVTVICSAQPSEIQKKKLSADDVLQSYAQRVHTELLPRASELRQGEVIQLMGEIAAKVLMPHKDLLLEKAKAELAELPKLTLDLSNVWQTVSKVDGGVIASTGVIELAHSTSQPDTEPVNKDAILLLCFWNAKTAAYNVRTQMLVRHSGTKEFGQRAMIETLAHPLVYAINADPERPVIAIETGAEMFVVNLKRMDAGYYVDVKAQWLKRKDATSQPAGAAHED